MRAIKPETLKLADMELKVLKNRPCVGQKSFYLIADDELGYTVTLLKKSGELVVYNNLSSIDWYYEGRLMVLCSVYHGGKIELNALMSSVKVTITKADKLEDSL